MVCVELVLISYARMAYVGSFSIEDFPHNAIDQVVCKFLDVSALFLLGILILGSLSLTLLANATRIVRYVCFCSSQWLSHYSSANFSAWF